MSEQAAYTHRSANCARCTREVWVFVDVPDPVLCEFCSGAAKPLHHQWEDDRRAAAERAIRASGVAFLERVDSFLSTVVPNPERPGAFGHCPYCHVAFVLKKDRVVHPGGPCSGRKT